MYNAGRQYGIGTERQRAVRDRVKSTIERYNKRIDSSFARKGISVYGDIPVSRRTYMGLSNG